MALQSLYIALPVSVASFSHGHHDRAPSFWELALLESLLQGVQSPVGNGDAFSETFNGIPSCKTRARKAGANEKDAPLRLERGPQFRRHTE